MAVSASHAALPYPIKGARFSMLVPMLDADGDPTAPTTPDTEISEDNAAATDAAEEVSATSGMDGMGLITFTGAETDCSSLAVAFKAASGPKTTLATLYPRVLAIVGSGTLSAGSAGGGTLGTLLGYDITGCFIKTTGGTGGGGTGGASNQVRSIITYTPSTGAFTVAPNWETTPSTDTTYDVLLPEGLTLGALRAVNPTTVGRTLDVTATGAAGVDWGNVENPTTSVGLSGTTVGIVTLVNGLADGVITAAKYAANAITSTVIADGALTAAKAAAGFFDAVWTVAARILTAATNITSTGGTTVPQTGDSFARIGATGSGLTTLATAAALATAQVDLDAIDAKTTNLPSDPADQSLIIAATNAIVALLGTPAGASVSADLAAIKAVDDAIKVVTDQLVAAQAEPTGVPSANPTPLVKIARLHQALRNALTVTATKKQFFDDAGAALWEKDLSDDGTVYTETEANAP